VRFTLGRKGQIEKTYCGSSSRYSVDDFLDDFAGQCFRRWRSPGGAPRESRVRRNDSPLDLEHAHQAVSGCGVPGEVARRSRILQPGGGGPVSRRGQVRRLLPKRLAQMSQRGRRPPSITPVDGHPVHPLAVEEFVGRVKETFDALMPNRSPGSSMSRIPTMNRRRHKPWRRGPSRITMAAVDGIPGPGLVARISPAASRCNTIVPVLPVAQLMRKATGNR